MVNIDRYNPLKQKIVTLLSHFWEYKGSSKTKRFENHFRRQEKKQLLGSILPIKV